MNKINELKSKLQDTSLGDKEQKEFFAFLSNMPEVYISDILEMSEEDKSFLPFLWSNYDRKKKAFDTSDVTLMDEVIKEETEFLQKENKK